MRVAVIHPLKHHVYYSMAGVMESGAEVIGLFGYYDKNDFLDNPTPCSAEILPWFF